MFCFAVLETEPQALSMLGRGSATELTPSPRRGICKHLQKTKEDNNHAEEPCIDMPGSVLSTLNVVSQLSASSARWGRSTGEVQRETAATGSSHLPHFQFCTALLRCLWQKFPCSLHFYAASFRNNPGAAGV